jgi:hypothetical protein
LVQNLTTFSREKEVGELERNPKILVFEMAKPNFFVFGNKLSYLILCLMGMPLGRIILVRKESHYSAVKFPA